MRSLVLASLAALSDACSLMPPSGLQLATFKATADSNVLTSTLENHGMPSFVWVGAALNTGESTKSSVAVQVDLSTKTLKTLTSPPSPPFDSSTVDLGSSTDGHGRYALSTACTAPLPPAAILRVHHAAL